ncbi:30S ribosomal protein S4e [Candidatus Woesearchaeota archaeon]|nr:30S ribosomal protein S4e [Candidatus Woesearchaeota archaeon]
MKNHLKRIIAPRTWMIDRQKIFIAKPNPGTHPLELCLPLGYLLRDILKHASTMNEVQKMLRTKSILIDGKRQLDPHFPIGLFDTMSLPDVQEAYRLSLDKKGRLTLKKIEVEESTLKLCKVVGKSAVKGGKVQLHLHDGRNILFDKKAAVGDTLAVSLPELSVQKVLPLEKESSVFLMRGKHAGDTGVIKELKGKNAVYTRDNQDVETLTQYLFVVGDKKPMITL